MRIVTLADHPELTGAVFDFPAAWPTFMGRSPSGASGRGRPFDAPGPVYVEPNVWVHHKLAGK